MLFTTPTHWAALGITLVAGWLFGFASSSGGKKWKRQLEDAELAHAEQRDRDEQELRAAQARIRELEAQLKAAPDRTAPIAAAAVGAGAATLAHSGKDDSTPEADETKSWIPEGPSPPPLAMGTPEPAPQPAAQPIAPDLPPAPATAQEEVSAASTETNFPAAAPEATAPQDSGGTAEAAPTASDSAEPSTAPTEGVTVEEPVQKSTEWLPPHVRAEEPQH